MEDTTLKGNTSAAVGGWSAIWTSAPDRLKYRMARHTTNERRNFPEGRFWLSPNRPLRRQIHSRPSVRAAYLSSGVEFASELRSKFSVLTTTELSPSWFCLAVLVRWPRILRRIPYSGIRPSTRHARREFPAGARLNRGWAGKAGPAQ